MTDEKLSPAQRYAISRRRDALSRSVIGPWIETLDITLDDFQLDSARALVEGHNVLVAAPTGAGKTIVAEVAIRLALAEGRKAFYTAPIKALSNQKYVDLAAEHGEDAVGLLTGDTTVNGEAQIVVMTTEVLRNMLYGGSSTLADLGYVVMDEVHYLADRHRGPVWEEVILHLDPQVRLVALSATVSNAEEFGAWLDEVRGHTVTVVSEHRPVPLSQHLLVADRLVDLYRDPGTLGGKINPALRGLIGAAGVRTGSTHTDRNRRRGGGPRQETSGRGTRVRRAPRPAILAELDRNGMLPAIVFIFSRAGCDAAVDQLRRTGLRLTSPAEAHRIRRIIDHRCDHLPGEDLAAVGFERWAQAAERGFAAHHAGMLPVFKQTVEELFTAGLVKVVYATETLALGVNMPARSVVIEQTDKWDGSAHSPLTPGEYTQLTGRAGRRGIDVEGHAVVVYTGDLSPDEISALAATRTFPLRSRFHPTYNMVVNLLDRMTVPQAREVMERSFAQFQADRSSVGLARQVRAVEARVAEAEHAMACDLGDTAEYGELRAQVTAAQKQGRRDRSRARREAEDALLTGSRRGDIISYRAGRRVVHAVVLEVETDRLEGPRALVLTDEPRVRTVGTGEGLTEFASAGRLRVPGDFHPRSAGKRKDLASTLRAAIADGRVRPSQPVGAEAATDEVDVEALRAALTLHPCHACPDRETHAHHERQWRRHREERDRLVARIESRTAWLPRDFDNVCAMLHEFGYLEPGEAGARDEDGPPAGRPATSYELTDAGQWLARIYTERDLLLAECLRDGAWDGLDGPGLAAAVALVVYTARRDSGPGLPALPGTVSAALQRTGTLAATIARRERAHRLERTTPVDPGLVSAIWTWARGGTLNEAMVAGDLSAGDLVRWCKQVIDVLDQLQEAPLPGLSQAAANAIALVRRGVVAWSGVAS